MRILIAEDDHASSKFMQVFFSKYGECGVAFDGLEAVHAFIKALEEKKPFDIVSLDIMMPKLDGLKVLQAIRDIEKQAQVAAADRAKIIMTTALNDKKTVSKAFDEGCETYLWKPIEVSKLLEVMETLNIKL